jgi:sulfur carrier protein ThiS
MPWILTGPQTCCRIDGSAGIRMKLHLGGSLAWYEAHKRSNLDIPLAENISLNALLKQLSIPKGEVAIISVNGDLFDGDDPQVSDGDNIKLYPPIGGG